MLDIPRKVLKKTAELPGHVVEATGDGLSRLEWALDEFMDDGEKRTR